jgi:hypothetical protein
MATPSTVISRGLGTWGSLNLLPTRGFGSATTVVVTPSVLPGPRFVAWDGDRRFTGSNG